MTKEEAIHLVSEARKRAAELAEQSDSVKSEYGPGHSDGAWEDSGLISRLADALEASEQKVKQQEFAISAFWNEHERLMRAKCGMPSIDHLSKEELVVVETPNGDQWIVHKDIGAALAAANTTRTAHAGGSPGDHNE
jgi:hypothetical protein